MVCAASTPWLARAVEEKCRARSARRTLRNRARWLGSLIPLLRARALPDGMVAGLVLESRNVQLKARPEEATATVTLAPQITAAPQEYETFITLAIERPDVEKTYKTFFGDIYQLDARLLPDFDVVTLFHLCEFRTDKNDLYGALTDRQVLDMLTAKTRKGGYILFYTKSFAFDSADKIVKVWEKEAAVEKVGLYETLLVYRKK